MTRILIPLLLALLLLGSVVSSGQVTKTNKVPAGKTYVYLDENGKEVARRKSGSTGITDCAEIPCPPGFGKDVVCWKCKKRPTTKTQ